MNPDELPTEFPDQHSPDNGQCPHHTIAREYSGKDVAWVCVECSAFFVPAEVAQELEAGLEIAAAQIALVMVQYTERMADKYGPMEQEPPDPCQDGHDIDPKLGKCRRCDFSPYLGAQ